LLVLSITLCCSKELASVSLWLCATCWSIKGLARNSDCLIHGNSATQGHGLPTFAGDGTCGARCWGLLYGHGVHIQPADEATRVLGEFAITLALCSANLDSLQMRRLIAKSLCCLEVDLVDHCLKFAGSVNCPNENSCCICG
jgi:hypothetical protein